MAAVLPQPHLEVVDELHPAPKAGEDEEIVDLNADPAPAPAAAKPEAAPAKPAAAEAPAAGGEDEEIPAAYRGKSPKELAKMLHDSQQLIGRQGSELGDLRKKADMAIQASLEALRASRGGSQPAASQPAAAVEEKIDDVDFFKSPQEAIAKAIAASPLIKEIKATLGQSAAAQAEARAVASTQRFNAAHPDAAEIMATPEFQQWVGASRVRTALLRRAHEQYDFDSGDEVFGTWKALKGAKAPAPAAAAPGAQPAAGSNPVSEAARTLAAARRKQDLNDAAAPTGGNAAPSKGGTKRIFRRADVLTLMEQNPERYEQLAPEIELAYREGRVR